MFAPKLAVDPDITKNEINLLREFINHKHAYDVQEAAENGIRDIYKLTIAEAVEVVKHAYKGRISHMDKIQVGDFVVEDEEGCHIYRILDGQVMHVCHNDAD